MPNPLQTPNRPGRHQQRPALVPSPRTHPEGHDPIPSPPTSPPRQAQCRGNPQTIPKIQRLDHLAHRQVYRSDGDRRL